MNTERDKLLWKLSGAQLAALETQLYLDTHPGDCNALAMYHKYVKQVHSLKKAYVENCGPLTPQDSSDMVWDWVDNPWPWEGELR